MNININDIKNGMTVILDGNLCMIVEFQHVKPGKGPAFVRIKYKNLKTVIGPNIISWNNKYLIILQKYNLYNPFEFKNSF